jgi:UDP-N-acetylmuramyl pentapeptide phosphotransferase/UDP-N-acetylglucosamine-1-phosphate transferase
VIRDSRGRTLRRLSALTAVPVSAAVAGVVSRVAVRCWTRPRAAGGPAGTATWARTNHRGEPISLLEGPAFAVGALAGLALVPAAPGRVRCAALLAGAAAAGLGAYDDLAEPAGTQVRKGLAGHLGALARGQVTTGAVKVVGLAASGLLASVLVGRAGGSSESRAGAVTDVLVGGAVVAGSANLVNLLDLRPGRALKAVLLAAPFTGHVTGPGAPVAAAAAGAALALLPDDLAERTMLGDTGANAAGALLGVAALVGRGRRSRAVLLGALVALTAASEKVSFTRVIERTPGLREVDGWGRRPLAPPAVTPAVILA